MPLTTFPVLFYKWFLKVLVCFPSLIQYLAVEFYNGTFIEQIRKQICDIYVCVRVRVCARERGRVYFCLHANKFLQIIQVIVNNVNIPVEIIQVYYR